MIDFKVLHIGKYTKPQTADYIIGSVGILFNISGLEWMKINEVNLSLPKHFLSITPPDSRLQFEFNRHRYNWAITIETDAIRAGKTPYEIEMFCCGKWTKLNKITPIDDEHVSGWESEFLRMQEAFRQPTPLQQFRAELGITNILRNLIDRQPDSLRLTPAGKFKQLLDEGLLRDHTLDQISKRCGYSADHLRILFKQEFGITPLAYHGRIRMNQAMTLIDNSELKIKEIAEKCGFAHAPHFCSLFKKTFGMTPMSAIKKMRHK